MKWLYLLLSILFEVSGTVCLKLSAEDGPHQLKFIIAVGTFYLLCFAFLGGAMKSFPLSVVYATWSGVGVTMLAIVGVYVFNDPINPTKVISFLLVIAGVVGLNLSGVSH